MARGDSGRIVLEIDPAEKQELKRGNAGRDDAKGLVLAEGNRVLRERGQGQLFEAGALAESPVPYRAGAAGKDKTREKTKSKRRRR